MILDTTFVVDLIRGDHAALALRDELETASSPLHVPSPVLFEIWEGIDRARYAPREREAVEDILGAYATLPLTPEHARRAGILSAGLLRRGIRLGEVDLLLAGMALVEGEEILSRNVRDFERVPDLRVRTY